MADGARVGKVTSKYVCINICTSATRYVCVYVCMYECMYATKYACIYVLYMYVCNEISLYG